MRRGLTAEIDLAAAGRNLAAVRRAAGGTPVIAVVKADAYGHGAVELGRAFQRAGAEALAVAFLHEALQLRESGISGPVIVLFDRTGPEEYFEYGLTPVVHDIKTALMLSDAATRRGTTLDIHVKLDTGMSRMGFEDPSGIYETASLRGLRISGLMSHFANADMADRDFSLEQLKKFNEVREGLMRKGISPACHIANSAAALSSSESRFDAIRPGIALYGCSPFEPGVAMPDGIKPVMSLTAPVLRLRRIPKGRPVSYGGTFITGRDTLAAVVAAGYADGLGRWASNRSAVLVNGKRAPILGRVCMDLAVADVTEAGEVDEFSDAVLMGRSGDEGITAEELAAEAGTIPYEILLRFGRLASRRFVNGGEA